MDLHICVMGTFQKGKSTLINALLGTYELKKKNVEVILDRIEEARENYIRALTRQIIFDFANELHQAFITLENDETKIRKIENEFFTDIQKFYSYHACMIKHQLARHETGKIFKPVKIIQTNFVKLSKICNKIQNQENPMTVKSESKFRVIRKKESCSKEEVRLKPPRRCILELLFQTLERTLKSLEEIIQKQWKEWQYPQNRVRINWIETYQESKRKFQRYENRKIHPGAFQYRGFYFIIT